jgi:hypothetical protein
MPIEKLTFLEEGNFTGRDLMVWHIADRLLAKVYNAKKNILPALSEYLSKEFSIKDNLNEFRKRTASQIIESNYFTGQGGCTDCALVFATLARQFGIPTKYVETFDSEWLKNPKYPIKGHIFTEVFDYVSKSWKVYDPSKGPTSENRYAVNGKDYTVAAVGLDFSHLYKFANGKFSSKSIYLYTFDSIIKLAREINKR